MRTRLTLLLALLAVGACGQPRDTRLPVFELRGATMGTTFSVKLVAPGENLSRDALGGELRQRLEEIEQTMSTYREQSELSRFNASASTDWVTVSSELCHAFEDSLAVSRLTGGAFDVTVGPLVNLWGFGPDEQVTEPPNQSQVDAALARVGFARLVARCETPAVRKTRPDVYVDLSGWAKGYAVDQLALLLDGHGLGDYLVEIGGELKARGLNAERRQWAVAIEQALDNDRLPQTVLRMTDNAVATSGDYRNFFEYHDQRYSHTIDGRTGRPVTHRLSAVTVIDKSAAFADAMATALLVLGPEAGPQLAEKLDIAGFFLVRNNGGMVELTTSVFDGMKLR